MHPVFSIKKRLLRELNSLIFMPLAGLEPARCYPLDFESSASANSATAAHEPKIIITHYLHDCKLYFCFLWDSL